MDDSEGVDLMVHISCYVKKEGEKCFWKVQYDHLVDICWDILTAEQKDELIKRHWKPMHHGDEE
jgi:hypothetical protein